MGIHFTRQGSGEPLILVHGLGGTSLVWGPVLERLARERDVINLDLPGFGRSPALSDGVRPTAANLGLEIVGLFRELGVERPHLAGNSLGAWVSLEIAAAGKAASVCAISPAGMWRDPIGPRRFGRQRIGRRLRPLLRLVLATARGRRAILASTVAHPERVPAKTARALVFDYLRSPGYEAANAEMRAGAFCGRDRVTVPVTIAWGTEDRRVGRPSRSRRPAQTRYLEMPGWGHTPTWDDPAGVAGLLLEASASQRLGSGAVAQAKDSG
ncbi:MAG: alpha/beta fold hydrolase [Solirubrobacterales bacterium]